MYPRHMYLREHAGAEWTLLMLTCALVQWSRAQLLQRYPLTYLVHGGTEAAN